MKKRMLTMLLALILVLAALPVASMAAESYAPELIGALDVADGGTYYTSLIVGVSDEDSDLTKVTLNGEEQDIDDPYVVVLNLEGNKEATYVIHAEDSVGNTLDVTLYMKSIAALVEGIAGVTEENVTADHWDAVLAAEQALMDVVAKIDDNNPESELNELVERIHTCQALEAKIQEVEATLDTLQKDRENLGSLTSETQADYAAILTRIQALLGGQNLTDFERESLETTAEVMDNKLAELDAVLKALDEGKQAASRDPKTVTAADLDSLKEIERKLTLALNGTYLTEAQRTDAEAWKAAVTALREIAEKAAEEPKPTEPAKPTDPTNPATGDGMNVALSAALCLAAAIGMAGVAISRKKF